MQLDIDHLRGWIGREESASELMTPVLAQRFNAMLDREGDTAPGADAPRMVHYCLCQPAAPTAELGEDGHPSRGGFLPPVPLPRRMRAGSTMEFTGEIRIGETVSRVSRILDVSAKEGRSGLLCFVTLEDSYASDGRPVLTERTDIVYRGPAGEEKAKAAPPPAPAGAHVRTVTPTPPLLFRYSAVTFIGHRIHYDLPYAREVEGYPGLIVHGPLQGTMLVHMAQDLRGALPARVTVRAMSPIFDTADFTLNATDDGEGMKLWTASANGPVGMEARVQW
ncbi:MaoC family dehydratase N-terminal domain-containing protein [Paracoccus sp. MC1862]|uniref:FAS1-like dehydratase domain-containing protein n=1 Tax=Paracoccus sp. MC1862 TaxID=2760307 RepID=UPI0016004DE5|nr:MaoC family dehydratase N-terminal domain-containing protein [Paracoccus sp. MC1862]MBB1498403.1 MaoC family dehydratase N-terminal domain-containing protein [Paracoccus sp. MC1862]QQO46679.1 MaoC family dehydratase N-terminal domain-containing protein [Paracoccus sp. MC1862]